MAQPFELKNAACLRCLPVYPFFKSPSPKKMSGLFYFYNFFNKEVDKVDKVDKEGISPMTRPKNLCLPLVYIVYQNGLKSTVVAKHGRGFVGALTPKHPKTRFSHKKGWTALSTKVDTQTAERGSI
jgi:hypothetical protein